MESYTYGCIMNDITSNCNLRCKFCVNDWRNIRGNVNMSEKTFLKVMELIPLTMDEGFFFSCGFEPTIHPNYVGFLKRIPENLRKKVFFTTNLSVKLPIETIYELSQVNINHITVSLDSLTPTIFEELRSGAKFDIFLENLKNMVSIFKQNSNAPRIRYITMVFKQNMSEIVNIAKACHYDYLADEHEFRTPFEFSISHIDEHWAKRSLISREEWDILLVIA